MRKNILNFPPNRLLFAGISLILLVLLASLVNWSELASAFARAKPWPLFGAFLLALLFPLLNTLRWLSVLKALDLRVTGWRAFKITMACWPAGTLTPGKLGELLKAAAVPDRAQGLGSVATERVIDVGVLGGYGVIFGSMVGSLPAALAGAAGLAAAITAAVFAGFLADLLQGHPTAEKLRGFLLVSRKLVARPRLFAACLLASGLNWFLSIAQLVLLLEAFGGGSPWLLVLGILPAAIFAGLIPLTIAGAGTRDAALLLLAGGALDPAALLASSIMYTFLGYFLLGVLGLPFLGMLREAQSR